MPDLTEYERVVALETPIPATGRLGLWKPPEDVLAMLPDPPTGGAAC